MTNSLEDKTFTAQVSAEFGFSPDIVGPLVEYIRSLVSVDKATLKHSQRYFDMMNKLLEPDNSIQSIVINTVTGPVELSPPDPYFDMFANPIERVIKKHTTYTGDLDNSLLHGQKIAAFETVVRFVLDRTFLRYMSQLSPEDNLIRPFRKVMTHETILIPYRQCLAIGRFVLHFGLWAKPGHVLMTPKQWDVNETKDIDHNHYLASRIKTRLK